MCDRESAPTALDKLPFGPVLLRLYADARRRGLVNMLSTSVTTDATPLVIAFVKSTASAFEQLTLAARAWNEQVAHSDAEGRMVLADTLALAARDEPSLTSTMQR